MEGVALAAAPPERRATAARLLLPSFARVLERTGPVPVLLERDANIPGLRELVREMVAIRAIAERSWRGASQENPSGSEIGQQPRDLGQVGARS